MQKAATKGRSILNHAARIKVLVHYSSGVSAQFSADAADTMLSVYLNGTASTTAGSCQSGLLSCRLRCPSKQKFCTEVSWRKTFSPSTHTRTLIPVLNVDDARHGGVKVGSNKNVFLFPAWPLMGGEESCRRTCLDTRAST
jgi:hypothetical protein